MFEVVEFNSDTAKAIFQGSYSNHLLMFLSTEVSSTKCSSQPSMVRWLSSSIFNLFVSSFVRPAMVTSDKISTFFNIYWHKYHKITQYHF